MEYHDVPPQQRPGNINAAPRFVEPQVHPMIDGYVQGKLKEAEAARARYEKINSSAGKNFARTLDDEIVEVNGRIVKVVPKPSKNPTPETRIHTLQEAWRAAARGDFTGVNAEIEEDIEIANYDISKNSPEQVEAYDNAVAELAQWQAALQAQPVDQNSLLGQQIYRTIRGLIQKRDSTSRASSIKELERLQQVQETVNALSQSK